MIALQESRISSNVVKGIVVPKKIVPNLDPLYKED
jgi:hypothetical protein